MPIQTNLINKMNIINTSVSSMKNNLNLSQATNINTLTSKIKLPSLQSKTANLSKTSTQIISFDANYDGLSSVTVPKVTAAIDNYIKPENIKRNVEILGVLGTYGFTSEIKYADASATNYVTVVPSAGINYLEKVIINPVRANIDGNIIPNNIKSGVSILGVTGTYEGDILVQPSKIVTYNTLSTTVFPDEGYNAIGRITVYQNGLQGNYDHPMQIDAQTAENNNIVPGSSYIGIQKAIVTNIQPNIIRHGYKIFNVVGNFVADENKFQEKTVTPSGYVQNIIPDQDYDALAKVTVEAVTSNVSPNIRPEYILSNINILGVTGNVIKSVTQAKTVTPSSVRQVIGPDLSYTGLSSVTVEAVTSNVDPDITPGNIKVGVNILGVEGNYSGGLELQEKSVMPSAEVQNIVADSNYDGLSKVTVGAVTAEQLDIEPSKSPQNFTPAAGNFYNYVHVRAVSSDCDPNIQPENIKKNMSILGVTGTYAGDTSDYFGALVSTGNTTNGIGSWIDCIKTLPSTLPISGNSAAYLFAGYKGTNIPSFDTSSITNFAGMFAGCTNLRELPAIDISKGQFFYNMFLGCSSLINIPNLNLTNSYAYSMFAGCTNLTSANIKINHYTGDAATSFSGMFSGCTNLRSLNLSMSGNSGFNITSIFSNCSNLEGDIDFNGAKLVSTSSAFYNCMKINCISNFYYNSVDYLFTTNSNTFYSSGVKYIENATLNFLMNNGFVDINSYAQNCKNLISVSANIYVNCKSSYSISYLNIHNAFANCYNLKTVYMNITSDPSLMNTPRVTRIHNFFANCYNLTTFVPDILERGSYINSCYSYCYNITDASNISFKPHKEGNQSTDATISMGSTFYRCNNLRTVTNWVSEHSSLNTTVSFYNTFQECTNLQYVNLDGHNSISPISYILVNAFTGCTNLEAIYIAASNIRQSSFRSCSNLKFIKYTKSLNITSQINFINAYYGVPSDVYIFCNGISGTTTVSNVYVNKHHVLGEVDSITIANMPNKLAYNAGESFDPTGMILTAQNLLDANYDLDNHEVVKTLGEEYTLSTYSIDKDTLSAGDTSVNVYVQNPLNNISVEIPITVE